MQSPVSTRRLAKRSALALVALTLVAAACGTGTTDTGAASESTLWQRPSFEAVATTEALATADVPDTLAAASDSTIADAEAAPSTAEEAPADSAAPTTAAPVTTAPATTAAPPTTPAPPTTAAANTCSTAEFTLTLPAGIQTAPSGQFSCTAFAAKAVPVTFECDCTLSLTAGFVSGATNASLVTDYEAAVGSPITTTPLTVAGFSALQMEASWPLSEVQVGGTGQSAMRYVHLIEKSNGVIVVIADEFADWNDATTYSDRKVAADAMVASLVP